MSVERQDSIGEFANSYELLIEIKKAAVFGGGLPHDSYVETVIDGEIYDTTVPRNPAEWNKLVSKPLSPNVNGTMVILFAVYKKRWTAPGYKLVGTVEFTLNDLKEDIRKANKIIGEFVTGSVVKDFTIRANRKNITLSGTLTLGVEIKQQYFFKDRRDGSGEEKFISSSVNSIESSISGIVDVPTVHGRIMSLDGRRKISDLFNPANLLERTRHRRKSSFSKLQTVGSGVDVPTMADVDSEKEKGDFDDTESCRNSEDSSSVRLRSFSFQENLTQDMDMNNLEAVHVEEMYSKLLDYLLTPAHVKKEMIQSQSLEKKKETLQIHKKFFEGENAARSVTWGDKENKLIASIKNSTAPDFHILSKLKAVLSSANRLLLNSFMGAGGLSALMQAMENRMSKKPQSALDAAVMYEIMLCLKAVMNNSTGMEGVLASYGAIDTIARSLCFDFKLYALLTLEVLSVCCYYSEKAAKQVIDGMRLLARAKREPPFACLCVALMQQDIEVKAAVLQFVNSMAIGVGDFNTHSLLRADLNTQLFGQRLEETIRSVENEMKIFNDLSSATAEASGIAIKPAVSSHPTLGPRRPSLKTIEMRKKISLKSLVIYCGPKALDEKRRRDVLYKHGSAFQIPIADNRPTSARINSNGRILTGVNPMRDSDLEFLEEEDIEIKPPSCGEYISNSNGSGTSRSTFVNPRKGTMAGLLTAVKNTDTIENRILSNFKATKTKVRWFELDHEFMKSCHGDEKNYDFKKYIPVASIVSIRPYTTDSHLLDSKMFAFEIETHDRTYSFGCESEQQKSFWLTALQTCWDNHVFSKGTYKAQSKDLTMADISVFEGNFKKQAQVYHSLTLEDRKFSVANSGVDLTNISDVSKYLVNEALAAGNSAKLLKVLQLLLLIPTEADGMWDAIASGIQRLLMLNGGAADIKSADAAFADSSVTELLKNKAADGGNAYAQMNKLALFAVSGEQEIEHLRDRISVLEETIQRLESDRLARDGGGSLTSSLSRSADTVVVGSTASALVPTASGQASSIFPASSDDSTANATKSKFERFEKMRKLLPEGAVRQKMTMEGFSNEEIDGFFSEKPKATETVPSSHSAEQKSSGVGATLEGRLAKFERLQRLLNEAALLPPAPTTNSLSTVFDERLIRYEKMFRMLQDVATVRRKMMAQGCTAAEVDKFFHLVQSTSTSAGPQEEDQGPKSGGLLMLELNNQPPEGMSPKPRVRPTIKMKGLFWSKIPVSEIPGTHWHKLEDYCLSVNTITLLEDWFYAKAPISKQINHSSSRDKADSTSNEKKLISLLDSKRTQTMLIVLAKINKTPEEIVDIIVKLDPMKLTHDMTQSLLDILPNAEELALVRDYTTCNSLDQTGRVLFHLNRIPGVAERLELHEICFSWLSAATETASQLRVMQHACDELTTSQSLMKRLLAIILAVGNYINGGTPRGQAYGVQMDTFEKVAVMKASTPTKGSLLTFLVHLVETEAPELLQFSADWKAVWAATEVSLKQLAADVVSLEQQVERVSLECAKLTVGSEFLGLDGLKESADAPFTSALLNRLNAFLDEAGPKVETIRRQYQHAEQFARSTMALFGEKMDGQPLVEDPCKQFFTTIVEFTKAFYGVVDDNTRRRAEEKRSARVKAQMAALQEAKKAKLSAADKLSRAQNSSDLRSDGLQISTVPTLDDISEDVGALVADGMFDDEETVVPTLSSPLNLRAASTDESMDYIRHTILGTSPGRSERLTAASFYGIALTEEGEGTGLEDFQRLTMSSSSAGFIAAGDNIFERFHTAQTVSSDIVVDEYSNKLKKIGSTLAADFESVYP